VNEISDYLPHQPPMRLLDRVIRDSAEQTITEAQVTEEHVFFDPQLSGVPSWAGLEYLAQTAAVWLGADCQRHNRPIEPAFLVSSRYHSAEQPVFALAETLRISVSPDLMDGPLVAFSGTIHNGRGELLVEASFAAFQPEDPAAYLQASEPN
jgi:predicted hotdog family 3-hydroxylacyl-ACP dehydratase